MPKAREMLVLESIWKSENPTATNPSTAKRKGGFCLGCRSKKGITDPKKAKPVKQQRSRSRSKSTSKGKFNDYSK